MTSDTAAIVLASGTGQRMAKGINKVLLELLGKPLLFHTLQKLKQCSSIGQIVVVISNNDANQLRKEWGPETLEMADVQVEGGEERWISCKNGCQISNEKLPFILVQDAARALTSSKTIRDVITACRRDGAAIAAEKLIDTLKEEGPSKTIKATKNRELLWKAQTPQATRREFMLKAIENWSNNKKGAPTDESMMLEAIKIFPTIVPSPASNFKITTADDLAMAEALLQSKYYCL